MKTLLFSIFLSLGIHALLMSLDTTWFKLLPTPTPHPNLITISLVAAPPRGDKKAQTPKKPPGAIEKKVKISKKKDPPPSKKVVKQVPKKPAEPKRAVKSVMPPVEKIPQHPPIKQERTQKEDPPPKIAPPKPDPVIPPVKTLVKKEVPVKKIKPKKSLKRITKGPKKITPAKEVAQIKPLETLKPVSKTENPAKKSAALQQERAQSETPESPTQIKQEDRSGNETASEETPEKVSTALATKGDTSQGAGLTMARPLYRKNPSPKYPRRARKKGYEGNVILEVFVDEKGSVLELKVFKSSGYEILDKSALSSVQKWLFEPGIKNGKVTKMWVRVPIRFRLN